jgi:tetratricopeptide (TPR) repeat protein
MTNPTRHALHVYVLGQFRVSLEGKTLHRWPRASARHLLGLLAMQRGKTLSLEAVSEHFWPGEALDATTQRIHNLCYLVRSTLHQGLPADQRRAAPKWLEVKDRSVALGVGADVWVDALDFDTQAHTLLAQSDVVEADITPVLALYSGPLLVGDDSPLVSARRAEMQALHRRLEALRMATRTRPNARMAAPRTKPAPWPSALRPLIGREPLLKLVSAHFASGARLVNLLGPGGVGKSRLSLALADDLADGYDDGVAVALLADVEPAGVIEKIMQAMGLDMLPGDASWTQLKRVIAQRSLLLILDNCEHVRDALSELGDLLATCPGLHVLASSRRRLNLGAETVVPVPGLRTSRSPQAKANEIPPAVVLFLERAKAANPDFVSSRESLAKIEVLVAQVDGLPLAIELIAARAGEYTPAELVDQWAKGAPVAADGGHDRPARQRSLEASLAWSLGLLNADEREALNRLLWFAAPFDPDQAQALIASEGPSPLQTLQTLIELNLINRVTVPGAPSARLAVPSGALKFLRDRVARTKALDRYVERFVDSVYQAAQRLDEPLVNGMDGRVIELLHLDRDNHFAALELADAHGLRTHIPRMVRTFSRYWGAGRASARVRQWLDRAQVLHVDCEVSDSGWIALALAGVWKEFGDHLRALDLAKQAVEHGRAHHQPLLMMRAVLLQSALSAQLDVDLQPITEALQECLALPDASPQARWVAKNNWACAELARGDLNQAQELWLACSQPTPGVAESALMTGAFNLSLIDFYRGDVTSALERTSSALHMETQGAARIGRRVMIHVRRAWMLAMNDAPDHAQADLDTASALSLEAELSSAHQLCRAHRGCLDLAGGRYATAIAWLRDGLLELGNNAVHWDLLDLRLHLAWSLLLANRQAAEVERALAQIRTMVQRSQQHEHPRVLDLHAVWWHRQGDTAQAKRALAHAAALRSQLGIARFALHQRLIEQHRVASAHDAATPYAAEVLDSPGLGWLDQTNRTSSSAVNPA